MRHSRNVLSELFHPFLNCHSRSIVRTANSFAQKKRSTGTDTSARISASLLKTHHIYFLTYSTESLSNQHFLPTKCKSIRTDMLCRDSTLN